MLTSRQPSAPGRPLLLLGSAAGGAQPGPARLSPPQRSGARVLVRPPARRPLLRRRRRPPKDVAEAAGAGAAAGGALSPEPRRASRPPARCAPLARHRPQPSPPAAPRRVPPRWSRGGAPERGSQHGLLVGQRRRPDHPPGCHQQDDQGDAA